MFGIGSVMVGILGREKARDPIWRTRFFAGFLFAIAIVGTVTTTEVWLNGQEGQVQMWLHRVFILPCVPGGAGLLVFSFFFMNRAMGPERLENMAACLNLFIWCAIVIVSGIAFPGVIMRLPVFNRGAQN